MASRRRHNLLIYVGLGAILLAFVALGVHYSLAVPLLETPDEPAHYRYVRYVADERSLPPLIVSDDEWIQGEFHQPPLYYVLGAWLTGSLDGSTPLDHDPAMARNPYQKLGLPEAPDNKNAMLHLIPEEPGSGPTPLCIHLLRWLGVLFSTGTVVLVFLTGRAALPDKPMVALLATAVTAFNPQFVFASAAANNDSLITLLAAATLYVAVRIVQGRECPWATPIMMGALIGAAGLTKMSGLALGVLVPLAYGLALGNKPKRSTWRDLVRPTLIAAAVALAICGWWYVRNLVRYDDLMGMRSYRKVFQVFAEPLPFGESVGLLLESFVSYWGVFGWMNVLAPEPYYLVMRLLCLLACGGIVLRALQRWQRGNLHDSYWRPVALLAIWLLIMVTLLFRWTQTITRTQGRLLFPAVTSVSIFLVLGLEYWLRNWRVGKKVRAAVCVLLVAMPLGVSAVAPTTIIEPAYDLPATLSLDQLPQDMHGLDIAYGDSLVLLGFEIPQGEALAGERCQLRLYWLCRQNPHENLTVYAHLFGRYGQRIGALDTFPGLGNYPTSLWTPGEVIVDDIHIPVNAWAEAPVAAQIRVGVYHTATMEPVQATHLSGRSLADAPAIGRVRIQPHQETTYRPANSSGASLDDRIVLVGSSLPNEATVGASLRVKLYWRCVADMADDYSVFLHMVQDNNDIPAQTDGQPLDGDYPTSYWVPGEEIEDIHYIALPTDLKPGNYEIRVGLYQVETGQRLAVQNVPNQSNALTIGTVQVTDAATP